MSSRLNKSMGHLLLKSYLLTQRVEAPRASLANLAEEVLVPAAGEQHLVASLETQLQAVQSANCTLTTQVSLLQGSRSNSSENISSHCL